MTHIRTLQTAAALLSLLGSCVKKSEYDALQVENQALQTRVDQTNRQLLQAQIDASVMQAEMLKLGALQTQLQDAQQELIQSQEELRDLKAEFDEFRVKRRSAMVGKKFPMLSLDDGKVLREAEITALSADEVSIRHADGFLKVALANTSPDLRWEACYDPLEAKEKARKKMLARAQEMEARRKGEQGSLIPVPAPMPARNVVDVLRSQLTAQRAALNSEYQALAAKNPAALRGDVWNSAQPENSPLLTTLSGSRAVLGISRLQSYRSAILATLQQLRALDPSYR